MTAPRLKGLRGLYLILALFLVGFTPDSSQAQDAVVTHVFDVGAGLCTVTEAPPGHYLVYDVGRWQGTRCTDAISEVVEGDSINILVVSHPDSDHLGEVEHVLDRYEVGMILRTGFERWDTGNWREFNDAAAAETYQGASILNLQTFDLEPGTEFSVGEASLTFVAGWGEWERTSLGASDARNAVSIVLRLDYGGRSILFAGDAVGRSPGRSPTDDFDPACAHGERVMVERHDAGTASLEADVLIAPHHGANNASATCFIERVDPGWVVFSAGSQHGHPRDSTAHRYLDQGVQLDSIFRTDRGDEEEGDHGDEEWEHTTQGCKDGAGDDALRVRLTESGGVEVGYLGPSEPCEEEG